MKTGPLSGVRIVDISSSVSGPLATGQLADQGADVIKIEPPGSPDMLRRYGSTRNGFSAMFHVVNRGKRSMVLDLRQPKGLEVLKLLVRDCHVFVQNFRPGVVERLGIDYDALSAELPDLIYASISGFGPTGPYAHKKAFDNVIQAYSGIASTQTDPDTGVPQQVRQLFCDKLTAYVAAQAVTAALFACAQGRGGQHVEVSMLDAAVAYLWIDKGADAMLIGDGIEHKPTLGTDYRMTPLSDGWSTTQPPISDEEFRAICDEVGRPELADDPRFATARDRGLHSWELDPVFQEELNKRARQISCAEAERRIDEIDGPVGFMRTIDDLPDDPQVVASEIFVETDHGEGGRLREPRPAPRFGGTPAQVGSTAPSMGRDTDEILREIGMADRIFELREEGVVA